MECKFSPLTTPKRGHLPINCLFDVEIQPYELHLLLSVRRWLMGVVSFDSNYKNSWKLISIRIIFVKNNIPIHFWKHSIILPHPKKNLFPKRSVKQR